MVIGLTCNHDVCMDVSRYLPNKGQHRWHCRSVHSASDMQRPFDARWSAIAVDLSWAHVLCTRASLLTRVNTDNTDNTEPMASCKTNYICARSNILRFPCILCDLCSFKRFLWNRLSKRGIIHGIPLKLHNLKWNGTEGLIFICGQSRASDGPTKTI